MATGSHHFGYRYHDFFMATVTMNKIMATVTTVNMATVAKIISTELLSFGKIMVTVAKKKATVAIFKEEHGYRKP